MRKTIVLTERVFLLYQSTYKTEYPHTIKLRTVICLSSQRLACLAGGVVSFIVFISFVVLFFFCAAPPPETTLQHSPANPSQDSQSLQRLGIILGWILHCTPIP